VLALPRAPQRLLPAVQQGRAAQREVSAQIFVGNALRRLRAAVGEPSAVISAHRAPAAPGGGELRLSLSSPFEPRDAEGFRCPLYPPDRAADVAAMLVQLLHDCRVTDIRVLAGVHPGPRSRDGAAAAVQARHDSSRHRARPLTPGDGGPAAAGCGGPARGGIDNRCKRR